jgi:hypothetical protein
MEEHVARNIRTTDELAPFDAAPYWVFVSNPKKWAIDRFLDREIEHDSWGIRPSDRERFAPGQLGIIRVGAVPCGSTKARVLLSGNLKPTLVNVKG